MTFSLEPTCRVCGCTQDAACICDQPYRMGVCYWVEDDLCSACAGLSLDKSFAWEDFANEPARVIKAPGKPSRETSR